MTDECFREEEGFIEDYPHADKSKIKILYLYQNQPTVSMKKHKYLEIEKDFRLPIQFDFLKNITLSEEQYQMITNKKNKKWWQFWI